MTGQSLMPIIVPSLCFRMRFSLASAWFRCRMYCSPRCMVYSVLNRTAYFSVYLVLCSVNISSVRSAVLAVYTFILLTLYMQCTQYCAVYTVLCTVQCTHYCAVYTLLCSVQTTVQCTHYCAVYK